MSEVTGETGVFALLRKLPLFATVSDSDLRTVAAEARSFTRPRGARIFEEGGAADSCYVLTSGLAKVVISGRRGKEVTLDVVGELELVGEIALLDRANRSASLVAAHECRFIRIGRASFAALRHSRAFEDQLVEHITAMLRRATEQLRAVHTFSSSERVEWCLAHLAARLGRRTNGTIAISPRPHHQDIADMTGCTRETVTRVMQRLKAGQAMSWNTTSLMLHERRFKALLNLESGVAAILDKARNS